MTRALFIGRAFRLLGIMIDSGVPLLGRAADDALVDAEHVLPPACSIRWKPTC